MSVDALHRYQVIIDEICNLNWSSLNRLELMAVALAYYYFSVQFRENIEIARKLSPPDSQLAILYDGEIGTDNLSPYPGVAGIGEKMNHDEFMRRVALMSSLDEETREKIQTLGIRYLTEVRNIDSATRANSLPTFEDGGLERVFTAILKAPDWNEPSLAAFRHFLLGHIKLDSNPDAGHGTLCRHLTPDDRVVPLWSAFRDILVKAAPRLAS